MKKFEVIKIFFIALIAGHIMGIILIQIFQDLTIVNITIMEIVLVLIIIMLFISSKLWNKRQDRIKKFNNKTSV